MLASLFSSVYLNSLREARAILAFDADVPAGPNEEFGCWIIEHMCLSNTWFPRPFLDVRGGGAWGISPTLQKPLF